MATAEDDSERKVVYKYWPAPDILSEGGGGQGRFVPNQIVLRPNFVAILNFQAFRLKAIHFSWLGPELLVCCLAHRGLTDVFLLLRS